MWNQHSLSAVFLKLITLALYTCIQETMPSGKRTAMQQPIKSCFGQNVRVTHETSPRCEDCSAIAAGCSTRPGITLQAHDCLSIHLFSHVLPEAVPSSALASEPKISTPVVLEKFAWQVRARFILCAKNRI